MEEKRTIRTHRVGTVTFGLILVVMGALFLLRMIFPALDYELIFRLWPLIFISLGIEVLASSRRAEEKLVYDGAAIFLLILLVLFAMGMAGMDLSFCPPPMRASPVSIQPGAMQLTRMPYCANSMAAFRVNFTSASLTVA